MRVRDRYAREERIAAEAGQLPMPLQFLHDLDWFFDYESSKISSHRGYLSKEFERLDGFREAIRAGQATILIPQSMSSAPKDRSVQLVVKWWNSESDSFSFDVIPASSWLGRDDMTGRSGRWTNVPNGWKPVAWMDKMDFSNFNEGLLTHSEAPTWRSLLKRDLREIWNRFLEAINKAGETFR